MVIRCQPAEGRRSLGPPAQQPLTQRAGTPFLSGLNSHLLQTLSLQICADAILESKEGVITCSLSLWHSKSPLLLRQRSLFPGHHVITAYERGCPKLRVIHGVCMSGGAWKIVPQLLGCLPPHSLSLMSSAERWARPCPADAHLTQASREPWEYGCSSLFPSW